MTRMMRSSTGTMYSYFGHVRGFTWRIDRLAISMDEFCDIGRDADSVLSGNCNGLIRNGPFQSSLNTSILERSVIHTVCFCVYLLWILHCYIGDLNE
jgi:hypothetical protein